MNLTPSNAWFEGILLRPWYFLCKKCICVFTLHKKALTEKYIIGETFISNTCLIWLHVI